MRYRAIATDGDGTLLKDNHLEDDVAAALERYRAAGGRLFLITGELVEQLSEFPRLDLFDHVAAENGAVLFDPATGRRELLCEPCSGSLVDRLREAGAHDVKCGDVVITAKRGDEEIIRRVFSELKLDWQIINNRKDLLLLPRGVDKVTGLSKVLEQFDLDPTNVAAIGDAENDAVMLDHCGLGVAVADALPKLKERAKVVTRGGAGRGMIELVDAILEN